jgi:hypothetical protein
MSDYFVVRTDDFPIVITVYPDLMTMETLPAYHTQYERVLARGERFASLIDMRPCMAMPAAEVRREMVDWGKRVAAERLRLVVGVAFIVTNPLVRAALAVVHWQAPPQQPTSVFKNTDPALEFLTDRLAINGIAMPDSYDLMRREVSTGVVRRSRPFDLEQEREQEHERKRARYKP